MSSPPSAVPRHGDTTTYRLARTVARTRRGRALHPAGVTLRGVLAVERETSRPLGVAVLDRPGRTEVVVRLSKATSLPGVLPDVLGLAVRVPGGAVPGHAGPGNDGAGSGHDDPGNNGAGSGDDGPGDDLDLLFSTCCPLPVLDRLPWPRSGFTAGRYSTLVAYRHRRGGLRLVADPSGPPVPPDPASLTGGRLVFHLTALPSRGRSWPLATLTVDGGPPLPDVSFDPVLNAHPELRLPGWLARFRRRAYEGSREGRAEAPPN
ncbi:hypothetical protein ACLQ2R_19805 [Streptosporangium sp. DT93]|uniref:hypothetical protein n=1 Tax=Streptosporangium sp. DT93 TaxID=3393428 RepID=UPI003CF15D40